MPDSVGSVTCLTHFVMSMLNLYALEPISSTLSMPSTSALLPGWKPYWGLNLQISTHGHHATASHDPESAGTSLHSCSFA